MIAVRQTPIASEKDRLESLLKSRLGNRIRRLDVEVRDAGIVLRGRSETYHTKQLAQHAAMEYSQLPILANDIEVGPSVAYDLSPR